MTHTGVNRRGGSPFGVNQEARRYAKPFIPDSDGDDERTLHLGFPF